MIVDNLFARKQAHLRHVGRLRQAVVQPRPHCTHVMKMPVRAHCIRRCINASLSTSCFCANPPSLSRAAWSSWMTSRSTIHCTIPCTGCERVQQGAVSSFAHPYGPCGAQAKLLQSSSRSSRPCVRAQRSQRAAPCASDGRARLALGGSPPTQQETPGSTHDVDGDCRLVRDVIRRPRFPLAALHHRRRQPVNTPCGREATTPPTYTVELSTHHPSPPAPHSPHGRDGLPVDRSEQQRHRHRRHHRRHGATTPARPLSAPWRGAELMPLMRVNGNGTVFQYKLRKN